MKFPTLFTLPTGWFAIIAVAVLATEAAAQAPATPAPATPATGTAPPAATPKPKPLAQGDETYLKTAMKSLNYQIQLANAGKSLTDQNKARLRDDTAKDLGGALQAITKLAEAHALKAPSELSGSDKIDLDRVNKGFAKPDKYYPDKPVKDWIDALVKESKRLDRETEAIGKSSQDADIKTFVTNYGPTIRSVFARTEGEQKAMLKKK